MSASRGDDCILRLLRLSAQQLDGQAAHWRQAARFQAPRDRAGSLEHASRAEADAATIRYALRGLVPNER